MQSIRITSRPRREDEVEPFQPVWMNIYQIIPIEDLSWLHFDDKPKVQEMQQVKVASSSYQF